MLEEPSFSRDCGRGGGFSDAWEARLLLSRGGSALLFSGGGGGGGGLLFERNVLAISKMRAHGDKVEFIRRTAGKYAFYS
jgi:hypothetical protein